MENKTIQIVMCNSKGDCTKFFVNLNETIESAKKRFMNQFNICGDIVCFYKGKILEDDEIFSEIEIIENDRINYLGIFKAGGGYLPEFGISKADISNKKGLVKGNFNKNAKEWNKVITGLNVSGICNNYGCEAYKQSVDCQIGLGTFDLVRDADRIKCPMCNEEIEPTTCCFSKCQYKFEGKKKSNGKTVYVKSEWKRVEKDYEYYDPKKSGNVNWLMLIIETKRL